MRYYLIVLIAFVLSVAACTANKQKEANEITIKKFKLALEQSDTITALPARISYLEELLELNNTMPDKHLQLLYNRLCFANYQSNLGQQAFEYGLRSVSIGKNLERTVGRDSSGLDNAYYNLALACFTIDDNESYAQNLRNSLSYAIPADYELKGIIAQGLAGHFVDKAKVDTSVADSILYFTQEAYKFLKLAGLNNQIPNARVNEASYFIQKKQFDTAAIILKQIISELTPSNNNLILERVLLAKCYIFQKKNTEAETLLYQVLNSLSDDNIKSEILVYSRLEELYEQQHNTTKLVNVSRILLELTDKNYSLSMANRLKDIEASNIVKQKDANIKELNLKNKIAGQQLQLRNILILLLLLVSAGAVLLIYQYYHSRKIKEENSRIVVEQKLFAAQITPHFMFNALSGVQAEILSNNPRQASNYLASFGQFLQSVLAGTTQEYISIGQEYKNLQHYLILQKIRFDNFEYEMIGYEGIEEDEDQIAPMLIQPLVENAIEHGVKQMDYKGMIVLRFAKDDQSFTCEVLDNGGGLSTKGKNGKLSVSTQLIQKRLQYLSKTSQTKAYLLIQDRADAHGVLSRIVMPVIKNN